MKARIILASLLFTGLIVLTSFKSKDVKVQESNSQIEVRQIETNNSISSDEDEIIVLRSRTSAVSNLKDNNL